MEKLNIVTMPWDLQEYCPICKNEIVKRDTIIFANFKGDDRHFEAPVHVQCIIKEIVFRHPKLFADPGSLKKEQ